MLFFDVTTEGTPPNVTNKNSVIRGKLNQISGEIMVQMDSRLNKRTNKMRKVDRF